MEVMEMKKTILFAAGLSLILTLFAQQPVKIKDATPFWFVYMEFKGSRIETPEKVSIFFQEIRKQELQTSISNDLFCILFDSPYQVGEARDVWALGFEIPEDTPVQLPLKKSQYHYRKIATMIYKGSYDTVGHAYNIILPYLEERDFEIVGPPVEKWLDDPHQVHPEECRTELIVPIREKKNRILN